MKQWRATWIDLGFPMAGIKDKDKRRRDIALLSEITGKSAYLKAFDELEELVQGADFWRYAVLYLKGGLYADIDMAAQPGIVPVLQAYEQIEVTLTYWPQLVFVQTTDLISERLGKLIVRMNATTHQRFPQFSNGLLVAGEAYNPVFIDALDLILENMSDPSLDWHRGKWAHTLLLTGPAVITDAYQMRPEQLIRVEQQHMHALYKHHSMGSWKEGSEWDQLTTSGRMGLFMVGCVVAYFAFFISLVWFMALQRYFRYGIKGLPTRQSWSSLRLIKLRWRTVE
ncbi:unnamed protein product [Chrysoparadoxa australica]